MNPHFFTAPFYFDLVQGSGLAPWAAPSTDYE